MRHNITNADLANRIGDCSVCGPNVELEVGKAYGGRKAVQRFCKKGKYERKKQARRHVTKYGITPEEFAEMLAAQDGMCKICNCNPATHVDHCHATGAVRGLLCNNCNAGLGMFADNQDHLKSAIEYLTASREGA